MDRVPGDPAGAVGGEEGDDADAYNLHKVHGPARQRACSLSA
jgi:hypothetical protein